MKETIEEERKIIIRAILPVNRFQKYVQLCSKRMGRLVVVTNVFLREVHKSKLSAFESPAEMFGPIDSLITIGLQGGVAKW